MGVSFMVLTPISAYMMHHTQVCLFYGRSLASDDFLRMNKTGYQDALTDPSGNKWFFITHGLLFSVVVGYFYFGTWITGLISIVAYFLLAAFIKRLLPSQNSPKWASRIHASMCRREADYKRDGDELRYEAIKSLREEFQARFEAEILGK